ncbi:MAG: hypothetical protein ACRENS_01890 [Candidatus Eiseniibacteriota bacterium]
MAALAFTLLAGVARARADQPVPPENILQLQACVVSKHIRVTTENGCLDVLGVRVQSDGLWCERSEPCQVVTALGPRQFHWEEIRSIQVGRTHSKEGALIGGYTGLAIAVANVIRVLDKNHNPDSTDEFLAPFGALLLGVPIVFGCGIIGAGVGSLSWHWDVCYERNAPAQPPRGVDVTR